MMSPEEWAAKFGDELQADAGYYCWNKQHEEKLALYFRQAMEEREEVRDVRQG
ncbi:hypothetical protein LCGC14_1136640 [marine sediment metagenome]|uniref:Uncharacterized protein n=1 Tax=marine sediment metagenome TaxID=412755 RepID=A0A0F9M4D1_9ZZZZ